MNMGARVKKIDTHEYARQIRQKNLPYLQNQLIPQY